MLHFLSIFHLDILKEKEPTEEKKMYNKTHSERVSQRRVQEYAHHLVVSFVLVFRCQRLRSYFVRTMFRFMLNKLNAWIRFCHTFLFISFFFLSFACLCSTDMSILLFIFQRNDLIFAWGFALHIMFSMRCMTICYIQHMFTIFVPLLSLSLSLSVHCFATSHRHTKLHLSIQIDDGKQWSASVFFHLMNMFDMCVVCEKNPFCISRESHQIKRDEEKNTHNRDEWILNFDALPSLTSSSQFDEQPQTKKKERMRICDAEKWIC